jgi:hypothetical protein
LSIKKMRQPSGVVEKIFLHLRLLAPNDGRFEAAKRDRLTSLTPLLLSVVRPTIRGKTCSYSNVEHIEER